MKKTIKKIQKSHGKHKKIFVVGSILILVTLLWWHKRPAQILEPSVAPVTSAIAAKSNLTIELSALGTVTPVSTITLQTQINGILTEVLFKEGDFVEAGQVLAQIDDSLLKAQLEQYEGQLMRDSALLDNAKIDLERYQMLWEQKSISQQTLATQVSLVKQYQGDVMQDQGLIASTNINISYCKITAPVSGRMGLRLIDPGNFVQTTATTGIGVLTQIKPITVVFSIPEDDIPEVLLDFKNLQNIKVDAYDRQKQHLLAQGTLLAIDNEISTQTGTINLKAIFANDDGSLVANQFVNISLPKLSLRDVLIVPTAAIQHGPDFDFVYKILPNEKAVVVQVKVSFSQGNNTVIVSGLQEGDLVVTEGFNRLTDGALVKII
jgi:membrane fusion protein, multidrug efflux system